MATTFGAESTTEDVLAGVNLKGKRILVTGASAGLGIETARAFAAHGALVVGAARDLNKAQARHRRRARRCGQRRRSRTGATRPRLARERAQVRRRTVAAGKPFDVIIANAGVMACPKGKTSDGFETQFGTNHLGHFVFVNKLVPLLKPGARIINLSSAGHRFADVDLDDPNFERTEYHPFVSYGRSKTANILFSVGLDRRLQRRDIRSAAVHPGGFRPNWAATSHRN